MIKLTVIASVVAFLAPFAVVQPMTRGYSADRVHEIGELHGYNRLVANPSADVVRASDVTIAVPARHVSRVIVDAPAVYTCQTRDLIQGSGQVTACYPMVAR